MDISKDHEIPIMIACYIKPGPLDFASIVRILFFDSISKFHHTVGNSNDTKSVCAREVGDKEVFEMIKNIILLYILPHPIDLHNPRRL